MLKIKQGDEVIVLTGKDKGRRGKVLRVVDGGDKYVVDGINMAKKHVRPNPQLQQQGGLIDRAMPIDGSNVAIYNPATSKADRVGFKFLEDGKKIRIFKSTGEAVDI